jgi:hypothetical protein
MQVFFVHKYTAKQLISVRHPPISEFFQKLGSWLDFRQARRMGV